MTEIPPVGVVLEREGRELTFAHLNTVRQLLNKLDLDINDCLVIRGAELLTADRKIHPGDALVVRTVVSRG